MEVRLIAASFLQMEVDAAEKRHRTRSKGVRGATHSHGISYSLNLRSNPFPHFQSITETVIAFHELSLTSVVMNMDYWLDRWTRKAQKISLLIIIWFHCVMKLMLKCFLTDCSFFFSFFFQLPWRLHKSCSGQSAHSVGIIHLKLIEFATNLFS